MRKQIEVREGIGSFFVTSGCIIRDIHASESRTFNSCSLDHSLFSLKYRKRTNPKHGIKENNVLVREPGGGGRVILFG